jgi:L-seryl-tRNA(Ser) seleniumtransferase
MRRHPLMRALRVDKLTYAALEGTLIEIARGRATTAVPVLRMLSMRAADIGARAERLAQRLADAGLPADVIDGESAIGGGSAPGARLPTRLLVLYPNEEGRLASGARSDQADRADRADRSADRLLAQLRACDPPVIARIEHDRVVLDLRTVLDTQDEPLAAALISALSESARD